VDLPAGGAGVLVGDVGADRVGKAGARVGGEGDAGRHVVEAERNRDRGGRGFVPRFVAQPDREGVGARVRHREVLQLGEAAAHGESHARVEAGRPDDPP
jgi:hypothetical protein